jgi:hypothetical protein
MKRSQVGQGEAAQPASPALHVIDATTRKAAASRNRLSRMNRELSLII